MNIYKKREYYELDSSCFELGALYMVYPHEGDQLLMCCYTILPEYVMFVVVDDIRGCYPYKQFKLSINDDIDPDLKINRVSIEKDPVSMRIYFREEKTDYKDIAEKLYKIGAEDSCDSD